MKSVLPVSRLAKLRGELNALVLAARQRGRRLPKLDVAKTYVVEHLDFLIDRRNAGKEFHSLLYGHVEHVGYRLALEAHLGVSRL